MFWTGVLIGLIFGAPLGIFLFSLLLATKSGKMGMDQPPQGCEAHVFIMVSKLLNGGSK